MSTQSPLPLNSVIPAVVDGRPVQGTIETPALDFSGATVTEAGKILRRHVNKMIPLTQALLMLNDVARDQDPRDMACNVGELRMNPQTGGLYRAGKDPSNALPVSHVALQQALQFLNVPRNACANMEYVTPATRAAMLADFVRKAERDAAEPLIFRTIKMHGRRFIRASVTPTHSQETGDDLVIAQALSDLIAAGEIPSDARTRIVRDLNRTDIEIVIPTLAFEVRRGDAVFAKLSLRNSETKQASFEANGGLWRLVCLNGMTRSDESSTVLVRHVGELIRRIRRAIQVASSHVTEFAEAFRSTYAVALPVTRAEALQAAGRKLELPETTLTRAAQLWDADGAMSAGDTLAGLVNALTRASQDESYAGAEGIEKGAGELIMGGLSVLGLA